MRTLIVIPCGKAKIWDKEPNAGPTLAREVYTGAPFKVNRRYAEKFGDRWVILSAKYGFIDPDFSIPENYNVTFKDRSTNPIEVDELVSQIRDKGLGDFDKVVALGGSDYTKTVQRAFRHSGAEIAKPAAGLPLGKAMGRIKRAIDTNIPF